VGWTRAGRGRKSWVKTVENRPIVVKGAHCVTRVEALLQTNLNWGEKVTVEKKRRRQILTEAS